MPYNITWCTHKIPYSIFTIIKKFNIWLKLCVVLQYKLFINYDLTLYMYAHISPTFNSMYGQENRTMNKNTMRIKKRKYEC